MLKKEQKRIAWLVILAFAWMMQVAAMPLTAAEGTGFVEVAGAETVPAKSRSILPLVLIGVGVVAAAAVLFLVVLKTNYDILGTWTVDWQFTSKGGSMGVFTIIFSGTKESGTLTISYGGGGTYTVDGKNVTWVLSSEDPSFIWTGQFDSKDTMSGTISWSAKGFSGTWTATRAAAVSLPGFTPAGADKQPWGNSSQD